MNPDHAPFYFSHRNKPLASDANEVGPKGPTPMQVRNTGTPTGKTGREDDAEDCDYSTPEGARKASMTQNDQGLSRPPRRQGFVKGRMRGADAGTSEGARKAAATRKAGSGGGGQRAPRTPTGQYQMPGESISNWWRRSNVARKGGRS